MKKVIVTHNVINSATPTALQIPLIPNNVGSKRIIIIWKTRVRRKEIAAGYNTVVQCGKEGGTEYIEAINQVSKTINTESVSCHSKKLGIISNKKLRKRRSKQL